MELAFKKGAFGHKVTWIGFEFELINQFLMQASVKPEFMETLASETLALSSTNVIGIRALRSYAGKCNHVAGLISCWRPFLTELWAALAAWDTPVSQTSKSPPPGTIWTKQIKHTLMWIQAFLDRKAGTLVRRIDCRVYWGGSNMVEVLTDASP